MVMVKLSYYNFVFLISFLSFQPLCDYMIFILALQMQASGWFGYDLWENGPIRVCYLVIPEPFLIAEKYQSIVNAMIPSTALPNIMGRDIKQGNDHRSRAVCGGKKLPTVVIKTTKKEEYLLPSK